MLRQRIEALKDEYCSFIDIETFPKYQLKFKEVSDSVADLQGFDSLAESAYDVENKIHSLTVSTNLNLHRYVVYHELTHIYDSQLYTKNNKSRYVGLSGFTEYHASQIELIQLLGAKSISQVPAFSMETIVETVSGNKSVFQYINEKHAHATELFQRADFPANVYMLNAALGVLNNYYGLRSICEMYATDYVESINNEAFLMFISSMDFSAYNRLMHGWLNNHNVEISIVLYMKIVSEMMQRFNLS